MSATKQHYHDQIETGQRRHEHKISWLNMPGYKPETWNPFIGCTKISPACDHCYAERMAIRLAGMPDFQLSSDYQSVLKQNSDGKFSGWNGNTLFREEFAIKPKYWEAPRMIFVCSMSDLFHEKNSFEEIKEIYEIMHSNKKHIFIVLTKRPERAYKFWVWLLDKVAGLGIQDVKSTPNDNVWHGVTAENQEQLLKRVDILLQIPAAKHIVSIEPMLGNINFNVSGNDYSENYLTGIYHCEGMNEPCQTDRKLDWVIVGGESGPKARPMHPDWVRSVRDQCAAAGVPFFFKQWGEWKPFEDGDQCKTIFCWPGDSEVYLKIVSKVGRKAAGDLIDGKQHHEWPIIQNS